MDWAYILLKSKIVHKLSLILISVNYGDFEMNIDKVKRLGFRPKISFEEGLNTIL